MPDYRHILTETDAHVALVRLNRPQALNALSGELMDELADALEAFDNDDQIRAIVLTGNERAFAAGADIREMASASAIDMYQQMRFGQWERIRKLRKPLIAAVSGFCLGGGNELAMTCDLIVAAESARFGQPEINIGVIPGAGGTQRLPRVVGEARAKELILLGRRLSADEALAIGLVNRVTPAGVDLLDDTLAFIAPISQGAPIAQAAALRAIDLSFETGLEHGLELERVLYDECLRSEDRSEALRAFAEKRKPEFKGR